MSLTAATRSSLLILDSSWVSPFFSFQSFSSAFSLRSLLHTLSFVLALSHFSVSLTASLCVSVSQFPFLISVSVSSRQMAGLGVTVRCLGGVMTYRVVGYTSMLVFSSLFSSLCFLNMCSLCQRYTVLSPWPSCCACACVGVCTCVHVCMRKCVCMHVCMHADRMGFCGETAPRVGQGTDWSLSLHVLTH